MQDGINGMQMLLRLVMGCLLATGLTLQGAGAQEWIYTVRPGDNLWDLTTEYLVDMRFWRRLQALNRVEHPRRMPPGMRLRIPVAWLKIQPVPVRVLHIHGAVEALTPETDHRLISLEPGMALPAGSEIHTGLDSNVTLEFADGSHLLLQANSHLILDTLSAYGKTGMVDTRMRLQNGRANSRVAPSQGPATRYQIQTPAVVSTVRGTDYRIGVAENLALTRAEVLTGRIDIRGNHKTIRIPAGFGTVAETGRPPLPPVPLLAPPDIAELPTVVDRVPIQLSLPPLDGAEAYRTQIASTPAFATLLSDRIAHLPRVRGPDLPDGDYIMRIRGIDARGLEGKDAYHRFTLNARPEPPVLLAPAHETTVREPTPTFRWAEPIQATGYRFQLAITEHFSKPILDVSRHSGTQLTPDLTFQPAVYYWRVATWNNIGELGPFSDTQHFELKPAPPGPELQGTEVDENSLTFRWRAGLAGQSYRFQMARDHLFQNLVVNRQTKEPQLTIPRLESGPYYLRIRTIDDDGFAGPYGMTQRIQVPPASYWPYALFSVIVLFLAL